LKSFTFSDRLEGVANEISQTPMNEARRVDQTVAATLEQQVQGLRNMQLARRTARASCMFWFAFHPRGSSNRTGISG
jgi:hypothetical protein